MQISKLKKVADQVVEKGKNHKGENCFLIFMGDTILDLIENLHTGILEDCKLVIKNGVGSIIRVPFTM